MNFESRLRKAEEALISERIELQMPDNTKRFIPGDGEHLMHLFILAMRVAYHERHNGPKPVIEFPQELEELGLIKASINDNEQEQGGGHLVSAIRSAFEWGRKLQEEVKQ